MGRVWTRGGRLRGWFGSTAPDPFVGWDSEWALGFVGGTRVREVATLPSRVSRVGAVALVAAPEAEQAAVPFQHRPAAQLTPRRGLVSH